MEGDDRPQPATGFRWATPAERDRLWHGGWDQYPTESLALLDERAAPVAPTQDATGAEGDQLVAAVMRHVAAVATCFTS